METMGESMLREILSNVKENQKRQEEQTQRDIKRLEDTINDMNTSHKDDMNKIYTKLDLISDKLVCVTGDIKDKQVEADNKQNMAIRELQIKTGIFAGGLSSIVTIVVTYLLDVIVRR